MSQDYLQERQDHIQNLGNFMLQSWNKSTSGNLFYNFLDDALAPLHKDYRLKHPWSPQEHAVLFELGKMYAEAVRDLPPFTDVLGQLYMNIAASGHKSVLGQFFTPPEISRMMALMSAHDQDWNKDAISFNDPCVGAGVMPLEFSKVALQNNALSRVHIMVCDIDIVCVKMTAIQFAANALMHDLAPKSLSVLHGDSLTVETRPFFGFSCKERVEESFRNECA